jgi:hypothetical protein
MKRRAQRIEWDRNWTAWKPRPFRAARRCALVPRIGRCSGSASQLEELAHDRSCRRYTPAYGCIRRGLVPWLQSSGMAWSEQALSHLRVCDILFGEIALLDSFPSLIGTETSKHFDINCHFRITRLFPGRWFIPKSKEFRNTFLISKKSQLFRDGSYFAMFPVSNREPSKIELEATNRHPLKNRASFAILGFIF